MLIISPKIRDKIGSDDHGGVTEREVRVCFMVWDGRFCYDTNERHKTDPQTRWFVCESHICRPLKIMYVDDGENVYLKSAYPATGEIKRIFEKYSQDQGE